MSIDEIRKDPIRTLCYGLLVAFIVYTEYFQYKVGISGMVAILGAAVLGAGFLGLAPEGKLVQYCSVKELNIYLCFFCISFWLGGVGSISIFGHIRKWFNAFTYFLLIPCILYVVVNKRDIISFTRFYLLFSVIVAVMLILNPVKTTDTSRLDSIRYSIARGLNSNILGMYFILGSWCALALTVLSGTKTYRALIYIGILLIASLATGSRKTFITVLLIVFLWLLLVWFPENKTNIFLLGMMMLLILIGGYVFFTKYYLGSTLAIRMDAMMSGTDSSNDIRITMYKNAIEMALRHPFTGWGFEGYSYYVYGAAGGYSHATYAEVPACTGFLGSAIYLYMYVYSFGNVIRLIRKTRYNTELADIHNLMKMAAILWICIFFTSITVIYIYELLCFITFGILFACIRYAQLRIDEVYVKNGYC